MRTLFVIALGLLLYSGAKAQVAVYTFDSTCVPNCSVPANDCVGAGTRFPFSVNLTVLGSAGPFMPGSGVNGNGTNPCTSMKGFAVGQGGPTTNRARWADSWSTGAYIANDNFNVTLSAATFATVAITRIDHDESRSLTGPRMCQVMFSTDGGFSFTLLWQGVIPDNASWRSWSITSLNALAPMPVFSNTLIVRFQGFMSEAATGSWRIDNVRFYAAITNLPIELLSFTGTAQDDRIRLDWSTATETNNDYFTVLKSYDLLTWNVVETTSGAGTSVSTQSYSLVDRFPMIGTNYYKLLQTDFDGRSEEFPVIAVEWNIDDGLTRITDVSGREVRGWSMTHDLTDLPAGMYFAHSKYRPPRTIVKR